MRQSDDTFGNHNIEEKIIAMIRTSPHLVGLFSEIRESYLQSRTIGLD